LVTIALDVLTIAAIWEIEGKVRRIVLIDEPDAHIHPDLQVRFADFIFRIAEHYSLQIAIATHSTSLLAALGQFGGTRTSAIYVVRGRAEFALKNSQIYIRSCRHAWAGTFLWGHFSARQFSLSKEMMTIVFGVKYPGITLLISR
jgi:ABC-type transporter Mla maintaining outer membrane lipid asymmetry ATPase subunit MlaF